MAYASKELKAQVSGLLKEIIPKGWRWSLSILEHRTIKLTIWSAPIDLPALYSGSESSTFIRLNAYRIASDCRDEGLRTIFAAIDKALNCENYDHSDAMTDYFNVGYYIEVCLGAWPRAFVVDRKGAAKAEAREIAAAIGRRPARSNEMVARRL